MKLRCEATEATEFERYKTIVDDMDQFTTISAKPLAYFIWTNTLRTSSDNLHNILKSDGFNLEPVLWHSDVFRIIGHVKGLGNHWTYLAGHFHIQEASSMLPVLILNPKSNERVLDLCASPGNKTAQIAVALNNQGTVVANDIDRIRLKAVRHMINRLGLMNVSVTCVDGSNYPVSGGAFDAVVVDVPCSCEGTSRRYPNVITRFVHNRSELVRKQQSLLRQAIRRCRTQGRIVYSTCTYAPEENESVIHSVMKEMPEMIQILPIQFPGLKTSHGLKEWQGEIYPDEMKNTLRIWPHHNDTGGFFVALLQKTGHSSKEDECFPIGDPRCNSFVKSTFHPISSTDEYTEILESRFGIPKQRFVDLSMLYKNSRDIYITPKNHTSPCLPNVITGLPMLHVRTRFPQLTTSGASAFGHFATKNAINLKADQLMAYLERRSIRIEQSQQLNCDSTGYVIVKYNNTPLGVGFYDISRAEMASLLPKSMIVKSVEEEGEDIS
ncbi:MAG: RsmB/NOP family class I SAM-dependent RNA methyltransferase [Desulfobacterales bacterium]|nr:RsmB/NOP family class I SAM-dependent RNA methyltransferase [Desulfobacterales bacterium]